MRNPFRYDFSAICSAGTLYVGFPAKYNSRSNFRWVAPGGKANRREFSPRHSSCCEWQKTRLHVREPGFALLCQGGIVSKPSPEEVEAQNRSLDFRPEDRPAHMLKEQGMMVFVNPANGHECQIEGAGLWAFLFGPLYFMIHGAWAAAIIIVVSVLATAFTIIGPVIVWIIGAAVAKSVVSNAYLKKGWIEKKKQQLA